jgi:hypothetical protein
VHHFCDWYRSAAVDFGWVRAVRAGLAVGGRIPAVVFDRRATKQPAKRRAAQRVAMKMGRRLRCSSVTYRFRYAPSPRPHRYAKHFV